jgi:hypothetical protein
MPYTRLTGTTVNDYTTNSLIINAFIDSKLSKVKSLKGGFKPGTNQSSNVNIFTGVISINNDSIKYVIDGSAINNVYTGGGFIYETFSGLTRTVKIDRVPNPIDIPLTTIKYSGSGWNIENTSLSAITKEEMFFGVVFPQKIQNDVFIERGTTSPFETHLRLSEINTLDDFDKYGNGFFNIITE